MTFKVGDRVRHKLSGEYGTVTEIDGEKIWIDGDNSGRGYDTESSLLLITSSSSFEDTAQKFSKTAAVSPEQAKEIHDLGSEIGIAESSSFEQSVNRITGDIANLLILKNKAYGDSALNPVRVFSKASRIEQLNVRIDDKISRIQRGSEYGDEDTIRDLIGYLVLRIIAEESE